jgi:hypothetical protein
LYIEIIKNYAKFCNKYSFILDIYLFLLVVCPVIARCIKLLSSKETEMDKYFFYPLNYAISKQWKPVLLHNKNDFDTEARERNLQHGT